MCCLGPGEEEQAQARESTASEGELEHVTREGGTDRTGQSQMQGEAVKGKRVGPGASSEVKNRGSSLE